MSRFLTVPQYILSALIVATILTGSAGSFYYRSIHGAPVRPQAALAASVASVQLSGFPSGLTLVSPGESVPISLRLKNTTDSTWEAGNFYLESIYTTGQGGRVSKWSDPTWSSSTRVDATNKDEAVKRGGSANFNFTMTAPQDPGLYKETFRLAIVGSAALQDPLSVSLEVAGGLITQSVAVVPKAVQVSLANQTARLIENGFIVATLPISSGKAGYATPKGEYTVMNKLGDQKSQEYGVWMGNWMGLVQNGKPFNGYGMHSLAYWPVNPKNYTEGEMYNGRLYTNGRLYEDVDHLGTAISHGCVRFGIYESSVVYSWVEVGTPVTVA